MYGHWICFDEYESNFHTRFIIFYFIRFAIHVHLISSISISISAHSISFSPFSSISMAFSPNSTNITFSISIWVNKNCSSFHRVKWFFTRKNWSNFSGKPILLAFLFPRCLANFFFPSFLAYWANSPHSFITRCAFIVNLFPPGSLLATFWESRLSAFVSDQISRFYSSLFGFQQRSSDVWWVCSVTLENF